MRRRVFWGVVGVVLVTLTAAALAGAVLINRSVQESVRSEFDRQAAATARLIQATVNAPRVPGGRQAELAALLNVAASVGGHDYVEAARVDSGGAVSIVGTKSSLLDQAPVDISKISGRFHFEAEVDGESVAAFLIPVRTAEGRMVIAIGTNLEIIPWRGVLVRFGWSIALGILLASLLAGWLVRSLARRLDGLRSASSRMAAGDLGVRIEVGAADEVAEVEVAFNEMAGGLQDARRREREFLVSVSHDLRTPLTTIGGYTEALDEGRVESEDVSRVAGVIHRESDRLRRLVEDLMLLARIEAREFSLRPEMVDMSGHLTGVAEAFRGKAEDAGVELETEITGVLEVLIDPDRIAQVVGNLIENALRYTPEGGKVRLGLREQDGYVRISVIDNGPGIEEEDIPHVFERLYVTQRYRPVRPEGSGLGLSIVKELVDAMAGTTDVSSKPGEGTTVVVRVPMAPPPTPGTP